MERTESTVEKTGPKGNWLVITGTFGRYIVRTQMTRAEVAKAFKENEPLIAEEAFEFTSQLQLGRAPHPTIPGAAADTVGKLNIAYRPDATCYPVPIEFPLQNTLRYWLDDLNQSDASVYKDIIRQAVSCGDGWASQRAENNSGVKLAASMPVGVPQPPGGR